MMSGAVTFIRPEKKLHQCCLWVMLYITDGMLNFSIGLSNWKWHPELF